MRKRNYTVTIRMNKAEYDLLQSKVKESGQNTAGSCNKSNSRFKDSIRRGSGRIEKTEPDVCGYPLSAPGSYDKYQPDCKKTAYRWRNPKRQYVVFPQ